MAIKKANNKSKLPQKKQTRTANVKSNLAKLKSDIASSKGKVADLMTSLRLKDRQISKISASQTNNITITDRRNLLEAINKIKKKEETNELD